MSSRDTKYKIALNNFPKFGPVRMKKLNQFFSSPEHIYTATANELIQAGIEENIAQEFVAARTNINPDALLERLEKENIKIISVEDEDYPKLLLEIYDPPPLLYYKGKLKKNDEFNLAVVGTRKFSSYGKQATEIIVRDLAKNNFTITSGLALGIDTLAHNACINSGTRTIAVLGTGIDHLSIYPSSNRYLIDKIIAGGGAVVSEFPLGTPPLRHNFPQRNRIISGLSIGTLVVEAGEKSGALITARFALDQNREVFAVPGNIYSLVSVGPNNLIKQGARPVSGANEIIEALDLININAYIDNKKIIPESREEEEILANISHEPKHIDDLIRLTGLDTSQINSTLILMEMKGMIKNLGNMRYVLAR